MLNDFIVAFPKAGTSVLCESLISWHDEDTSAKTETPQRDTRRDVQKWLPESNQLWIPLQNVKLKCLTWYLEEFTSAYRGKKSLLMPENKIQRTDPKGGGFHNFHSEVSHWENCSRTLAWTLYLNDIPNDESETEWLYENIKIQPEAGMMVIWPAAWMYQHRGNPVHTHSKYIATGWFWYPEEKFYYK